MVDCFPCKEEARGSIPLGSIPKSLNTMITKRESKALYTTFPYYILRRGQEQLLKKFVHCFHQKLCPLPFLLILKIPLKAKEMIGQDLAGEISKRLEYEKEFVKR